MVADPIDYGWSSHPRNAFNRHDPLIHPHPDYLALDRTDEERRSAYRTLAMEDQSQEDLEAICAHLQRQHALGSDRFRTAIEAQLSRRVGLAQGGRARKTPPS
jgi:putative transposase